MNIEIPTPRTDALAKKSYFSPSEWIEHARKLERLLGELCQEAEWSLLRNDGDCALEKAIDKARTE